MSQSIDAFIRPVLACLSHLQGICTRFAGPVDPLEVDSFKHPKHVHQRWVGEKGLGRTEKGGAAKPVRTVREEKPVSAT
jgi:hypothetical protein